MTEKQKTDVELSWESGNFEEDLRGLKHELSKEIWAHDKCQYSLQQEDTTWNWAIMICSIIFGTLVATSKVYFPAITTMLATISLTAVIPALMKVYAWRNPAGKRAAHILVSGQKSDIKNKINLQLIQKPKYRELAQTFYDWIHDEYSRVGGNQMAYLSSDLLKQYPEKKKER